MHLLRKITKCTLITQQQVRKFLVDNYDAMLLEVSSHKSRQEPREILSIVAEILLTKDLSGVRDLKAYAYGLCRNTSRWGEGISQKWNKDFQSIDVNEDATDNYSEQAMLINAETAPEAAKNSILDLIAKGYGEDQVNKILHCYLSMHILGPAERILFKLHFQDELTLMQIANKIGIPFSAVQRMVADMKTKIRSTWNNK